MARIPAEANFKINSDDSELIQTILDKNYIIEATRQPLVCMGPTPRVKVNLPRVVGWYHWNPKNRPKGALFRGYKKSRIYF